MHYTHKDPTCCSTTISKCKDPTHCIIRSNPHIFLFYSSQTIWSKRSACPVTLTPCCLRSIVKTFALSHASTRARPDSFMLKRFHSFVPTKKNKAHSQSNKPKQCHLQASIGQFICTVLHCLPKGLRWPIGVTVSDS